jgi:hypothetical protein
MPQGGVAPQAALLDPRAAGGRAAPGRRFRDHCERSGNHRQLGAGDRRPGGNPLQTRPRGAAGLHRRARPWSTWPRCARHGPAGRRPAQASTPGACRSGHRPLRAGGPVRQRAALFYNAEREFERNRERYEFLKWGQGAFENFRVVPPATGIVHQVNLEYLAKVVHASGQRRRRVAFPDSLVGTDSHTTMINGLGVVGWGVGGIEAEAVMLGQPIYMLTARKSSASSLTGSCPKAPPPPTWCCGHRDAAQEGRRGQVRGILRPRPEQHDPGRPGDHRQHGPEYGATVGFFPVDEETLNYMRGTGRPRSWSIWWKRYTKEQGLFRTDATPDPLFTDVVELDLSTVSRAWPDPSARRIASTLAGHEDDHRGTRCSPPRWGRAASG